jgi:hypothetical protein
MKILKYVLFVILALVILYFLMGIIKPSVSYGHEITVDKPLKETWAVTQDDSKYHQWLEGFQSIELIEGEQGQPGSKYKVIVHPGEGQPEFEMTQTVVSIKEFEHVNLHFDSDFMDFEQIITYAEVAGKTTVKSESKVIAKSWAMRSMFAIMETFAGSFGAQEKENFEALKKLIEENTTDYYPAPPAPEVETPDEKDSE